MTIRIALTGGGTGGHLYPLLSVADEIKREAGIFVDLVYFGPATGMTEEFDERSIRTHSIVSSKLRRYFDLQNIVDIPKFFFGIIQALFLLWSEMPDVVFSKGGPGALPVVIAAKWYAIPIVIHESDAIPSLTTRISAKFAKRILVSFKETVEYFSASKVRLIGNPIRKELMASYGETASLKRAAGLDDRIPNILVLGGSQGSTRINTFILDALATLLPEMQVSHQVGTANYDEMQILAKQTLAEIEEPLRKRYHLYDFFMTQRMKEALGAADIVISRAGSGAITEIAAAGKPAILVPLSDSANDHQRGNAYAYASTGAASVVEEANFAPNLIRSLIHSLLKDDATKEKVSIAAKSFFKPNAARDAAIEVLQFIKGFTP